MYASFHRQVDPRADIDRSAHEKAKHAASVSANRRSARGSIAAVIYFRPAAERVESTWSDRASEDGAAELVDSRLSIVTGRIFIPTKLTINCGGIHPNPNPRWLLDCDPLFSTRIFHIFEPRATGDIPSYAPPRGAVDDKGNITSWAFVISRPTGIALSS